MRANSHSTSELSTSTPSQLQVMSQTHSSTSRQLAISTLQMNRERIRNLRVSTMTDVVICISAITITGTIIYFAFFNNNFSLK
jgi:hypothetical protein